MNMCHILLITVICKHVTYKFMVSLLVNDSEILNILIALQIIGIIENFWLILVWVWRRV